MQDALALYRRRLTVCQRDILIRTLDCLLVILNPVRHLFRQRCDRFKDRLYDTGRRHSPVI